jgi:hypothetical protein
VSGIIISYPNLTTSTNILLGVMTETNSCFIVSDFQLGFRKRH